MPNSVMVGYARVSSTGQSLDVQEAQLREAGCEKIFAEKQSGRTARDRPQLQAAIDYAREGDTFVVTRFDRLARSATDLRQIVDRLADKGVAFRSLQQSVDTSRAEGRLFLMILGGFAEFEADIRAERQAEGIAKKKAAGGYKGRPTIPLEIKERALEMDREGIKRAVIARDLGIGRATLYRLLPPKETEGPP